MKGDTLPKPTRPLSSNFTDRTLRRAISAKRRTMWRADIRRLFVIRKVNLLKQPIGALLALAIVIVGGAGVYAATNWFNGSVQVTSTDNSIITVDLSKCTSSLPGGVDPDQPLDKVKFKIVGTPHISSSELEKRLLTHCEFAHVIKVQQAAAPYQVAVTPALVKQVDYQKNSITLTFKWGPWSHEATYVLAADAKLFDKGTLATLKAFGPGDFVTFVNQVNGVTYENVDPYAGLTTIDGLFKTQFDTRLILDDKTIYDTGNIMPLDLYNNIHH